MAVHPASTARLTSSGAAWPHEPTNSRSPARPHSTSQASSARTPGSPPSPPCLLTPASPLGAHRRRRRERRVQPRPGHRQPAHRPQHRAHSSGRGGPARQPAKTIGRSGVRPSATAAIRVARQCDDPGGLLGAGEHRRGGAVAQHECQLLRGDHDVHGIDDPTRVDETDRGTPRFWAYNETASSGQPRGRSAPPRRGHSPCRACGRSASASRSPARACPRTMPRPGGQTRRGELTSSMWASCRFSSGRDYGQDDAGGPGGVVEDLLAGHSGRGRALLRFARVRLRSQRGKLLEVTWTRIR